jgi:hypothetical protein
LGASGVVVVVVVVVVSGALAVMGAWTGLGASVVVVVVVETGASSFFLQPAAKTTARASTSVNVISFFITSPHFLNLPFKRYAHGFKNRYPSILGKNNLSSFFFRPCVFDI